MAQKIKFKCWEIENKQMLWMDNLDLTVCNDYPDEYILLQFTGLTDVNDVEIYEGDLVMVESSLEDDQEEKPRLGKIAWTRLGLPSFRFLVFNKGNFEYPKTCHLSNFEVVGNLHQTPEFLNN